MDGSCKGRETVNPTTYDVAVVDDADHLLNAEPQADDDLGLRAE